MLWLFWLGLVISGLLAVRYMFSADRRAEGLPTPPSVYQNIGEVDDLQLGPTHLRDDVWIVYSSESVRAVRSDPSCSLRMAGQSLVDSRPGLLSGRRPYELPRRSGDAEGAARPLHLGLPTPRGRLRLFPRHRRQRMSRVRTSPSSALVYFSSRRRRLLALAPVRGTGRRRRPTTGGGRRTAAKTRSRSLDPD